MLAVESGAASSRPNTAWITTQYISIRLRRAKAYCTGQMVASCLASTRQVTSGDDQHVTLARSTIAGQA
jgi:hypothetical protein